MPNWVRSSLTIEGKNSDKILLDYIKTDDFEDVVFDFNKIKEMPEDLNIIAGSCTDNAFNVYLSTLPSEEAIDKVNKYIGNTLYPQLQRYKNFIKSGVEIDNIVKDLLKTYKESDKNDPLQPVFKTKKDIVNYGKRVIDNIEKYGAKDWYDWSVKNWGTKWNACHCEFDDTVPNQIFFETAWSDVRGLICELSKKHPENTFIYDYAEEQIGIYTGTFSCKNGQVIEDICYDDFSKEAYEQSFNLWGECFKLDYKFNEETNTYERLEEDGDAEM